MKQYNFKINGNDYNVTINSVEGNVADVTVVASYKVELGNGTAPITVHSCRLHRQRQLLPLLRKQPSRRLRHRLRSLRLRPLPPVQANP